MALKLPLSVAEQNSIATAISVIDASIRTSLPAIIASIDGKFGSALTYRIADNCLVLIHIEEPEIHHIFVQGTLGFINILVFEIEAGVFPVNRQ